MSKNIVFEGWLTKSPPTKRIWRAKWRRRWFALRQSGELPGQYFLDYYADRNCRRRKGTINLDLCEQVDAGLYMERSGSGTLKPNVRGSVFTVRTQSRTYHLEADCEADMEKWVDAICRVCGLRATDDSPTEPIGRYQNNTIVEATNGQIENSTGPYIPISECITGVRDPHQTFTFEPKTIVTSGQNIPRVPNQTKQSNTLYNNADNSENESILSEDDCKSLSNSQSTIGEIAVTKTFTKLAINSKRNVADGEGPPVPPRPPKTFTMCRELLQKEPFYGPKIQEPTENDGSNQTSSWIRSPKHRSNSTNMSASPIKVAPTSVLARIRYFDEDDDHANQHSHHYCNLTLLPPAVDRALKPRPSSHSVGHINHLLNHHMILPRGAHCNDDMKADVLQYLDLDLHTPTPAPTKVLSPPKKKVEIAHGKSLSSVDAASAYKTVDFLKTEAFNITRLDAEALRNTPI